MAASTRTLRRVLHRSERALDRLWIGYKRRYGRFRHLSILTYRGYGNPERCLIGGRVLDDILAERPRVGRSRWENLANMWRRFETDEIPGARVRLRADGIEREATTGEDGYFRFELSPTPAGGAGPWHRAEVELLDPEGDEPVTAEARYVVPTARAALAIVSDLDDTVIRTGATDTLRMLRVMLTNDAHSRTPFDGVDRLYRALARGDAAEAVNPVTYVSSSPANLYDFFEYFLELHGLPKGPILLEDVGLSEDHFWKPSHAEHKLEQIEMLLALWSELPFVLFGDSGQRDPEIYRELVKRHPSRVRAIFIRDVTSPERDEEVRRIAREVERTGVPMALVADTAEAAAIARDLRLIPSVHLEAHP